MVIFQSHTVCIEAKEPKVLLVVRQTVASVACHTVVRMNDPHANFPNFVKGDKAHAKQSRPFARTAASKIKLDKD